MERLSTNAWQSLLEDCSSNLFEQGTVPPPGTPPSGGGSMFTSQMAARQGYRKPVSSAAGSGNWHVPSDQIGWGFLWDYVASSGGFPQGGFGPEQFWNTVQSAGAGFDWSQWGFTQTEGGTWYSDTLPNGMIIHLEWSPQGGWSFGITQP